MRIPVISGRILLSRPSLAFTRRHSTLTSQLSAPAFSTTSTRLDVFEPAPSTRTALPGFGKPVDWTPGDKAHYDPKLFPNALSRKDIADGRLSLGLITLREISMMSFMNSITDKVDWHVKVFDPKIAEKWKQEAISSGKDFVPEMAEWCIKELQDNANKCPDPIIVYNADVVKSDKAVSQDIKHALQEAALQFESAIPENLKDWHPESDQKVWDLVHPSLFPLVYGRTRVLANGETTTLDDCIERCGQGETTKVPPKEELGLEPPNAWPWLMDTPYSGKFQWLPCEVDISGEQSKITTYINNLHPERERTLYGLIERLIDASIPLWNLSLAPQAPKSYFTPKRRIPFDGPVYDPDPANSPPHEGPQQEEGEDYYAYEERREEWIETTQKLVLPLPKEPFEPPKRPPPFDLKSTYASSGLQVIVKLANIQLTPEKPEYEGGTWHVEGQMNEHIAATSLYYYSSENITTSNLSFRHVAGDDEFLTMSYRQDDHGWLTDIFGFTQDEWTVQYLGDVETREGCLLTFPNVLQHRVSPFKLADPSKPGHRKIVALFLVDPNMKIISTAHVPCQQKEWQESLVHDKGDGKLISGREDGNSDIDFPISMEDAKKLRLELMAERKAISDEAVLEFGTGFSLCEH